MFEKALTRLLLTTVAFTVAAPVSAQSTTQGAIAGTVFDPTDAVVPGASITIHNDGTNAEQHLTSDSKGFFNAPLLEPGNYTVSVTAPAFSSYTAKLVVVSVGKLTEVDSHLAAAGEATTVSVSADLPVLNFESPDASASLDRAAIDNIPVFTKRWSALALVTPGVTVDSSGYGLVQIRGISPLLNNVEIDGADDNQAYFSEERGRTRESYSTSPNAVREFEVNTGVYSAQFGRAAGGVINSVTRSGTNNLHGELFFTDLDRGFGAFQPGNVDAFGNPLKPKDLRKIYGGTVGGPLIKDKLFGDYTFDQLAHIQPGIAKVSNYGNPNGQTVGSLQEKPDAALPAGYACSITTGAVSPGLATTTTVHAVLDGQVCAYGARTGQPYANAVTTYNAGVQSLLGDFGYVPRVGDQEINTPKLDWQVNGKNRVSLLYHRLRWDSPGGVQTSSTANYSVDAFGNDFVKLDYGVAKLTSIFGSHVSNELLYQYGRELDDETQQPYSQYTLNNLVAPGASAFGFSNGPGGSIPYVSLSTASGSEAAIGAPYYSYRFAYPDERKWQIEDTLYYNLGSHSIRLGADFVHNTDLVNSTPYYFGYYSYSNLATYFSDLASRGHATGTCSSTAGAGVGTFPCFNSITQEFGAQTAFQIATLDTAGFIQDNWKVTPRLTLELGVRYDYEAFPTPFANFTNPTGTFTPYAGLANKPSDTNNVGPRIGFSMDVFGTGETVLRGGYGLYYGRIINATIGGVYTNTGSPNAQTYVSGTKPSAQPNLVFPYPEASGSVKPSSYFLAPNLQNPQVHEFDLQMQQEIGKGHVFQVSYLGALGRELPNFLDVNLAPPTSSVTVTVGNPLVAGFGTGPLAIGSQYVVPQFTAYTNPNFTDITEVLSNVNSSYHAMVFEIQNRSVHGLEYDANYTWSHSLDFNQNASAGTSTNAWLNPYGSPRQDYGNSAFNVGNRFAGYALYTFPRTHFSGNMAAANYLASGWTINDSFQMQNGLPYSATVNSSSYISSAALKSGTWNGAAGGTSINFIPPIGLNTFQVPRVIVDDLRLQKAFLFAEKYDLQFNADLYNVANHQNYSPGASGNVTNTAYSVAAGATATASTINFNSPLSPYSGFGSHSASNNSSFSYIPREIQVGVRLEF